MKLDKTDKQIVKILQGFGRESASNIAEKLNVSVPTVTERIKKLQDSNIITGFQAILSPVALGLDISAIITVISGSSKSYKEIISEAEGTPEVVQCYSTTGRGSHKLIVSTRNSTSLEELLRRIQRVGLLRLLQEKEKRFLHLAKMHPNGMPQDRHFHQ